jgi:hypothetical protein
LSRVQRAATKQNDLCAPHIFGYYINKAGASRTLVERWNGAAWKGG